MPWLRAGLALRAGPTLDGADPFREPCSMGVVLRLVPGGRGCDDLRWSCAVAGARDGNDGPWPTVVRYDRCNVDEVI